MKNIIDSHLHITKWAEDEFIGVFDDFCEKNALRSINICSIPMVVSNVCNNIMLGFYKIARPNTYLHGGIDFLSVPIDNMPKGMDSVTQYHELMDMGFDGIKMLEGKPTEHKRVGKTLNHPSMNALYAEMEKDGTHLLMHTNDPDEFWDEERAPQWAKDSGWTYLDGTFSSYEQIQEQTIKILENFPNLHLTLAHFFFCGKTPELLVELFEKYPNLCVDLTPGGEMYVEFAKNFEYYREFFEKYSDRLIFGTDRSATGDKKFADWNFDVVTTFIGTNKTKKGYGETPLPGLDLTSDKVDNIMVGNFVRRVGEAPKPFDKEKFKAYIEKYSFALTEYDLERIKPLYERYLGD